MIPSHSSPQNPPNPTPTPTKTTKTNPRPPLIPDPDSDSDSDSNPDEPPPPPAAPTTPNAPANSGPQNPPEGWCSCCDYQSSEAEYNQTPHPRTSRFPPSRTSTAAATPTTEGLRSHSNLHLDMRRITAANAEFHDYQRSAADRINAFRGTFPLDKPTMTLHNTLEYNRLNIVLPQLAYYRYRKCTGKLPFGEHTSDFRYVSPNHRYVSPNPHPAARSARLHLLPRSTTRRIMRLHKRMGHPPEDIMVQAVMTTWHNTNVTPDDIRRVFYRVPCLTCILAKRNHDSLNVWKARSTPLTPTPHPDTSMPTDTAPPPDKHLQPDHSWPIGSLIYYDNVGPINPASIEGFPQLLVFRDTRSKYIFSYPVKSCNEDIFLHYLAKVLRFFSSRGFTTTTLRSDFYSTFRSARSEDFYESNHCIHQTSASYQQWQNAAERDIHQTILANMSATIHSQDFFHADIWSYAVKHWPH